MNYFIITYGCQMNKSDSEKIAAHLEKAGHKPAKTEKGADLIIINVCSVRQSAVDRVYAKVNKYYKTKKIIITGCILKKDRKNFAQGSDLILDIKNLPNWSQKISEKQNVPCASDRLHKGQDDNYLKIKPKYETSFRAYVPISNGCNNFCTYCVVPYTRGREISRPAEEIIREVKLLVKKGYKEIVLIGQNVNSYVSRIDTNMATNLTNNIRDIRGKFEQISDINFPKLLRMINDIPGNFWLRFITSHPKDMSDELIETMAKCQKVCEYVHLPVQSGDNQILKKMNRHYAVSHYKNLIKKIRAAFKKYRPDGLPVAISTDIIVGFPGETKKQFQNTAKLMREIKFDMAYIARYSPRPGTAAFKMKDNVSSQEKKQREKILTDILKKTALEKNKKYIGKTVEVLIDDAKPRETERETTRNICANSCSNPCQFVYFGKTRNFKTVKISLPTPRSPTELEPGRKEPKLGDIMKTKILKADSFGLQGKIC